MASLYVAGPVIRGLLNSLPPSIATIYRLIFQAAERLNIDAKLPEATLEMELANPERFFEGTVEAIESSDAAITVFTGSDVSAGCEATIAALSHKRQLFIVEDQTNVPRLLRGLPGVVEVASAKEPDVLAAKILEFMKDHIQGDEPRERVRSA
jgi:hypothetical protein